MPCIQDVIMHSRCNLYQTCTHLVLLPSNCCMYTLNHQFIIPLNQVNYIHVQQKTTAKQFDGEGSEMNFRIHHLFLDLGCLSALGYFKILLKHLGSHLGWLPPTAVDSKPIHTVGLLFSHLISSVLSLLPYLLLSRASGQRLHLWPWDEMRRDRAEEGGTGRRWLNGNKNYSGWYKVDISGKCGYGWF
jgi:hypothetical protein